MEGFPSGTNGKEPACQCSRHKRRGFDPSVGKISWRQKWQSTTVFLLENPMDRGAWWSTVLGVTKSRTRLKQLSMHHGKKSLMSGWEQVFLIAKQCRNLWALKKVPLCKFFILLCQGLSQSACNCVCVRVCVCVHACARPSLTRWWILGGQGIRSHPPPSS